MPAKLTYKYVKDYFKEQGCELLEEEYSGSHDKMKYRCSCENVSKISFSSFQQGHRCIKCAIKNRAKKKRHTYKYVFNCFDGHGCILIEKEYVNAKTKMKYICSCGNESEICFNNFQQGYRCMECGMQRTKEKQKLSYEFVFDYFLENNCKLLETEYINARTKMRYICNCGNISEITFDAFKRGHRCKKCANMGKYSKESQTLFNAIYIKLNTKQKDKTYYATLNKEFGTYYKGKYFKYDYVNSKSKKAIEYNGSKFHPKDDQNDEETSWFIYDMNKTAKEARDYEKIKYEGLEKRGFQILTVWDHELHKDLDTLVEKCLDFLTTQ